MKVMCLSLLLAICGMAADSAEHPVASKRVWIRRITMATACAASLGFDTVSTHRAVAAGAIETNGLLAGAQGRPQWGRMIGIKAGVCGGSVFFQEKESRRENPQIDWTFTGVNLGVTAGYTWAGVRNLRLANDLSKSQ